MAVPTGLVGEVHVRVLCLESAEAVSGPQKQHSQAARLRSVATYAVNTVPLGSYVILVTFGTKASVLADRFVLHEHDRQVLREAIDSRKIQRTASDIAALESLIGHIRAELAVAFGTRGYRLDLQVLTDPANARGRSALDVLSGQQMVR
jgi:hypothetical protein